MERKEFLTKAGVAWAGGVMAGTGFVKNVSPPATIKAARLQHGDTVGFVAPAGIVFDSGDFVKMERVMQSMGLKVVFGRHVRNRYGYLSGTDKERAEDLNRFFSNPDINAIIAARGGWGSNRILPLIDFRAIGENPKFFCGFSDITSLHLAIRKRTGLVTFHGPNGTSEWTSFSRKYFKSIAFGNREKPMFALRAKEHHQLRVINPGTASGVLIGGNLSLVTSLIGTPYLPDMSGAILFLEDIGEDVYRIDRMLSQLHLSGILTKINGFIFGRCKDCKMGWPAGQTLQEVLMNYLRPAGIPAFYGANISHEPDNLTVPIGVRARMDASEGSLAILENALI